jgi:hypothetical protein
MKTIKKLGRENIALIVSSAAFLLGLSAFVYMGSFIRLIGDDYFLAANLKAYGFWGAQSHAYMNHVYFHGNRFSQTFILTVFSLFPPIISGIMPLLTIIVLIFVLYFFISVVLEHLNQHYAPLIRLTMSLIVAFFTLYLVPTVKQGLYWRSSMVSSFGTNIGAFLLGALILWKKPLKWYWYPLIFLYALFNAGLSENGAAYQAMMIFALLVFSIYLKYRRTEYFSRTLSLSITALIGTVLAGIIMWRSPGISIFKREISNSLIDAIELSFHHMFNFYKEMLLSKPLDLALILGLGFLLFFLTIDSRNRRGIEKKPAPLALLGHMLLLQILLVGFLTALMLPSAYTRNAYPDPRHFMGAVLVLMLTYLVTGFFGAAFIQAGLPKITVFSKRSFLTACSVAFTLISLTYTFYAIPNITRERLLFNYWATRWDKRHEQIVQAANAGDEVIHVLLMDHIIENVSELGPDPTSPTYNKPASIYYGITIIADQPGWDEGFVRFRQGHQ